jgi:uncharacterized repeat protein (TIGR01451 family)
LKQLQFIYTPISKFNDLAIELSSGSFARPGFEMEFVLDITNIGTQSIDKSTVNLTFPAQYLTFLNATNNGVAQNGQITWNTNAIDIEGKQKLIVRFRLSPTTPLSILLNLIAKIEANNVIEANTSNNTKSISIMTRGAYDPNDKTVLPEGKIPFFTNELDYLIRFQNTGTDTAFKVVVVDTLPSNVDVFTMKTVSASHPYTVSLNKNIVTFTFDNILLVDSIKNEKLSHGFIRFKIGTKAGLKVGDNISNKAAIYFDFNKPIITNTAKSELIKPSINLTKAVNICKGEKYNGLVINADMTVLDTVKTSPLVDTIYTTSLKVLPTYTVSKDTTLKGNLFEGTVVKNGDIVTKRFKTKFGGCDSIINFTITKINPTSDLPTEFLSLKIYPNPAKDYLSISYDLKEATWVEISLYNAVGQKVKMLQKKVKNTEGGYQLQADVKNLNSGTYQIEFQTENGVYYQRFVKME